MNYPIKKNKLIALQLILLIIDIAKKEIARLQYKKASSIPTDKQKIGALGKNSKKIIYD